jgi:integrase/recombinase XerD
MNKKAPEYYTKNEQRLILESIKNDRQRLICMLMLYGGLRISETISLKMENFNFRKRTLTVKSLKDRNGISRTIPLIDTLYNELADYIASGNVQNNLLFPSTKNPEKHITRQAVNQFLNRHNVKALNLSKLSPHKFRHSFGFNMTADNQSLDKIQHLLGHKSLATTAIYTHYTDEQLRESIQSSTSKKQNWFQKLFGRKRKLKQIQVQQNSSGFIGRKKENLHIQELLNKELNVIVIGDVGCGKSALLESVQVSKKVIRIEDTSLIKQTLINILIFLYNGDKEAVKHLLYPEVADSKQLYSRLNKNSAKALTDEIIKCCKKKEYILYINNIDNLSSSARRTLENLKDTFIIATSARKVKADDSSFLWNFERVELGNLTRPEALKLIHNEALSYNLNIEDYNIFSSHILEQSQNNPRIIKELIFRYSKEFVIDTNVIKSITHIGAIKEIDMSVAVLLVIATFAIFRYLASEVDNSSYRFIGGIAMIILLFSSRIFSRTKKKFI